MSSICVAAQALEQDDLVDPVQELGPEVAAHHVHHQRPHGLDVVAVGLVGQDTRSPGWRS